MTTETYTLRRGYVEATRYSSPSVEILSILTRNETSFRLGLQHFLWKDALEYLIHPDIAITLNGPGAKIADVGTGTG